MFGSTYLARRAIIASYDDIIVQYVNEDWQPYLVTFMFKCLPGDAKIKKEIMKCEVERVYSSLIPHVVRKPRSPSHYESLPRFIGCPDLPVVKSKKVSAHGKVLNDGWHFHGCLLLPPESLCRLRSHLHDHFNGQYKTRYYLNDHKLDRIHAVALVENYSVGDYMLKHYKRGNVSGDDILLLPRTSSELSARH